jgi:hypothetical protein
MTVLAAGNEYRFNLDGTYAALTELAGCVNRFTQVTRGPTPSMIPQVGSGAIQNGTVTADERLEATKVVANILAQGDMTGFRLLSSKEVADLNSEYFSKSDVVWKAEDVIGTLRIISKSAGMWATDIATAVVADDIKNCKGQSASGTTKDERSADIVRMFTACKDGKKSGWDSRYTVVPIGDGSYYLFAMGSPSSVGERGTGVPKADALLREAVYEVMKK